MKLQDILNILVRNLKDFLPLTSHSLMGFIMFVHCICKTLREHLVISFIDVMDFLVHSWPRVVLTYLGRL